MGRNDAVPDKLQSGYPQPTFASDSERQAFEARGKADWIARNNAFRKEFIASGKDIHSLPQTTIRTQRFGDGSLGDTVQRSSGVVRGEVVAQSVEFNGYIATTVRVAESLDGGYSGDIVVLQNGGPVLLADGPALARDDANPIVRPGREYLLFIRAGSASDDGKYPVTLSVAGVGNVYEIAEGALRDIAKSDDFQAPMDGWKLTVARDSIASAVATASSRAAR